MSDDNKKPVGQLNFDDKLIKRIANKQGRPDEPLFYGLTDKEYKTMKEIGQAEGEILKSYDKVIAAIPIDEAGTPFVEPVPFKKVKK